MYLIVIFGVFLVGVEGQNWTVTREVVIDQGPVRGFKFRGEDVISFYNIPYATVTRRFQIAGPPPTWTETFDAFNREIVCPQGEVFYLDLGNGTMQEDCLIMNVFIPDMNQTNLPVMVDIHGGAYHAGLGDAHRFTEFVALKNVIVVTFNYRVGIFGFLCLGTENIPGNAGMKDIILALRWVQRNIANFGGNPDDVTLSGCSAGGSAMDLLLISKAAEGLFTKAMPDSGSNLASFAVILDPVENAKETALALNFTNIDNIHALEEFFFNAPFQTLIDRRIQERTDTLLDYGPCVEKDVGQEIIFLDDAPYNILKSGNYTKYPTLYGLTNMESMFHVMTFDEWSQMMNENFADFLPGDLIFESEQQKQEVAQYVKNYFFGNSSVNLDNILSFVNYKSDAIFANSIWRTVKMHARAGHDKLYLYEYSYHEEGDVFQGALHCAQARAVRDEDDHTLSEDYIRIKAFLRDVWYSFIKTGQPPWPRVNNTNLSPHLSVGREIQIRGPLEEDRARFWEDLYSKYYRIPIPPILEDSTDGASMIASSYIMIIVALYISY